MERGKQGKLPHLFIPSKTATLVPEHEVEDLPLGRTAALVPEFAGKKKLLSSTLDFWDLLISLKVYSDAKERERERVGYGKQGEATSHIHPQ